MITPQFITDCINGRESAVQALVRAHQRGVFQIALTVIDDGSAEVHEAAQQAEYATRDTFIAALSQMAQYNEEMPFTTWLYQIAIQISRKRLRRWRFRRRLGSAWRRIAGRGKTTPEAHAHGLPSAGALMGEGGALTLQAVRRLNENLRLPLVLRYYHDFTPAEIARLLRLGEGAVHARLDAAREKIAGLAPGQEEPADD